MHPSIQWLCSLTFQKPHERAVLGLSNKCVILSAGGAAYMPALLEHAHSQVEVLLQHCRAQKPKNKP